MTLRYVTIDEDPPTIEEVILLVDGYVHRLERVNFTVIKDQELENSRSNGFRQRNVGVEFGGEPDL